MKIVVKLPLDRQKLGSITLVNSAGIPVTESFPVLGKSNGKNKDGKLVNPTFDHLKPFGNTPTGAFRVDGFAATGNERYPRNAYGENFVIQMSPTGGAALDAKERTGILIHAGRARANGTLSWTQGCLRVHEETMLRLLEAMVKEAPDSTEIIEVEVTEFAERPNGTAAENRFIPSDDDPPPAPGPLLRRTPMKREIKSQTFPDGTHWEGEMIDGAPSGQGKMTYANGDVYMGEIIEGAPTGVGDLAYANGDHYHGPFPIKPGGEGLYTFANGTKIDGENPRLGRGRGVMFFPNGDRYQGSYLNDLPDTDDSSEGFYVFADGHQYLGQVRNGLREGHGFLSFPGGNYTGSFHNGVPDGEGEMILFEGDNVIRHSGTFRNGVAHGPGRSSSDREFNGELVDGIFTDGKFVPDPRFKPSPPIIDIFSIGPIGIPHSVEGTLPNGDQFKGHGFFDANGRFSGQGELILADGSRDKGQWQNGKLNGMGENHYRDGSRYTGEFKDHRREGQGEFVFPDGDRLKGRWENSALSGPGEWHGSNGNRFTGEFKNSRPNGPGVYVHADGTRHTGEFKNGSPNGQGEHVNPDGSRYNGEFKDAFPNGQGESVSADGSRYKGQWQNGKLNGTGEWQGANGASYSGSWTDSKCNGVGTFRNPEGTTFHGQFVNGNMISGRVDFPDGTSYEGECSDGRPTGNGTFFDSQGRRVEKTDHDRESGIPVKNEDVEKVTKVVTLDMDEIIIISIRDATE